ncbi:MAG: lipopolysaccharide heptosyltransferase I [Epsilonproteobacteria bacterium]|nr:lipopolysaccharide heptosyltransferase I [Campylobacterota bacterium]
MKKDIKRIAIVRLSALGDIINSAIVLQFIKKEYPDAVVEWIVESNFASLLKAHHQLDAVHCIDLKKIKKDKNLSLLKQNLSLLHSLGEFDIVIDIQGLIKSSIVARLVSKNTHGFDKNSSREALCSLFYKTTSHIAYDKNIVKRNCFVVADGLGFEINDNMILNKEPIFKVQESKVPLASQRKNIAVVIGASWESKKYPKENVLELCNKLQQNCIIIWGNEEEKKVAQWICKNSQHATLAPKLSLLELLSFISSVDLLIGNDTGPTHMAWAQNVASITLFGPTTTRMIYETPKNIGLKSPSKVDIFNINKNDFSIKEIKISEIICKAKELLNEI